MSHYKFENPDNLSSKQLWLLATSSLLAELNHQRHDTLFPYGKDKSTALVKDLKQTLSRDWGIKDIADLSETMLYLHEKETFKEEQNRWQFFSEPELQKAAGMQLGSGYQNALAMIQSYQFNLPQSDLAWHYGRYAWLIRISAFVDYISQEEAWSLLEENAIRIREAFTSWEEFGTSYVVGAQYWLRETYSRPAIQVFIDNLSYLLTNKNSPWKNIAWEE